MCSLKLASLPNVYKVNSQVYLVKAKFIFLAKETGAFWLEISHFLSTGRLKGGLKNSKNSPF